VENSNINASHGTHVAPHGTWKSPITAGLISQATVGLGQVALDRDEVYWMEMRPTERGRTVLVRRSGDGTIADVSPADMSVRSRVHEYGGGSFVVDAGDVWFCNDADQRLYAMPERASAVALTPEGPYRYADMTVDRRRNRLIAVREEHGRGDDEPRNCVVSIGFDKSVSPLIEGADFYGAPRLSPDGQHLAWLSWSHPNMPWDGTELWLADVTENGELTNIERVAGGRTTSIFAPAWSPDGALHFVSDQTGWWNLYRWDGAQHGVVALCPMAAEFGRPQWAFGMTTYGFTTDGDIICTYAVNGEWRLGQLEKDGQLREIKTEYCGFNSLAIYGQKVAFVAGHAVDASALVLFDLNAAAPTVVRRAMDITIDPEYISVGEALDVPSGDGVDVHAYFYAPVNCNYSAPEHEKAPLIVKSHGGPTGQTTPAYSLGIQFWTSRGFAVLDVNYGGSSGYGRAYRGRLDGRWGEVDVEDCVSCVRYLVGKELVDGERVVITGGSAGGFTTLCALTFHDIFRAGASYYGIGDLEALARDTHKFESRYLDRLVGRWPEDEELYRARSPIHHTERLACPVIFFQGLDDKVVPPNQAKAMVDALLHKNLPVAYVAFEGEGHGFRLSENIERALQSELYFYGRVFDFQPADKLEPVDIANL
jgi:dipeptidyl aminopeptidase/acylaminoacyl peptidase